MWLPTPSDFEVLEEAGLVEVGIFEGVGGGVDGGGADAGGLERVEEFGFVPVARFGGDEVVEFGEELSAGFGGVEAGVVGEVGDVRVASVVGGLGGERVAEGGEFLVAVDVDGDPLVVALRGIDVVGCVTAVGVGLRGRVCAVHGVVEEEFGECWDEAFVEGHFDHLALAGAFAVAEGHEDGDRALDAGDAVGSERFADFVGAHVGVAAEVGVADHGFDVEAEGAEAGVGALQSEGGHAEHDQAGVDFAELFVGDAGLVDGGGNVVFDEDVAVFDQFEEGRAAFGGHDVAGHGALVAGV